MPAAFDKCVNGGGRVRTVTPKKGTYIHVCYPEGGGSPVSGEVHKKGENCKLPHKESISWVVPVIAEEYKVEESIQSDKIRIKGTAIKAKESRNGVTYELEAIEKAAHTLMGASIAVNHSENIEDIVGEITRVIPTADGLDYEGIAYNTVKHPEIHDLLSKGLVKHMSIVAIPNKIDYTENGKRLVKDMELIGLDFVRFPGFKEASVSLAEALEDYEEEDEEDNIDEEKTHVGDDGSMGKSHKCPMGHKWDEKMGKCMPMKDDTENTKVFHIEKGENMAEEIKQNETVHVLEKLANKLDETAKLREELDALRSEIKSLREQPKGNIVPEAQKGHSIVEAYGESERIKVATAPKEAFIKGKGDNYFGKSTMEVYPAHPEEFY